MFCRKCGAKIGEHERYCGLCGESIEQQKQSNPSNSKATKKKRKMSIVLSVALVISLIVNILLAFQLFTDDFSSTKIEGAGFDSPEESIVAYVEAFSAGNIEDMLSTFAIETYVQNFRFEEYIASRSYYDFYYSAICLPNDSPFKTELNNQTRQYDLVNQFKNAYFTLTNVDNSRSIISFAGENKEDEIENFVNLLEDPDFDKKIAGIKILGILDKNDFDYDAEHYDNSFKIYSYIDADEFCDVAAEIDYQGETYYIFMLTAKFDGKWYNISPVSQLGLLCGIHTSTGGIMMKES